MKKGLVLLPFVMLTLTGVFAQSNYRLEMERTVKDSSLRLEVYIRKTSGSDFALGASNFDIDLASTSLDVAGAKFIPGDFDASSHADSYGAMGMSAVHGLVMNVNPSAKGTGNGVFVSENAKKIGTVEIPITDPCGTVSPIWSHTSAAINRYTKTSVALPIEENASFVSGMDGARHCQYK